MRIRPLAFALLLGSLLPHAASAHAILMESQPPAQSTLAPGRVHVVLRFNSRIDQPRSRLELRGPAGKAPVVLVLGRSDAPDTLVTDATMRPGEWVLRWQVLAVDGHLTRGDIPLTVQAPTDTAPTAATPAAPPAAKAP